MLSHFVIITHNKFVLAVFNKEFRNQHISERNIIQTYFKTFTILTRLVILHHLQTSMDPYWILPFLFTVKYLLTLRFQEINLLNYIVKLVLIIYMTNNHLLINSFKSCKIIKIEQAFNEQNICKYFHDFYSSSVSSNQYAPLTLLGSVTVTFLEPIDCFFGKQF